MFDKNTYIERRKKLSKNVGSGLILLLGNEESGMNYRDNTYPFRQDSTFLYFFGIDRPGIAAIIDIDENEETVFGAEYTIDDVVWMGSLPTISDQANSAGVKTVFSMDELEKKLQKAAANKRKIHYVPPYRPENSLKLHAWLNIPLNQIQESSSKVLIKSIVDIRSKKSSEELREIENALAITKKMHLAAMLGAKEGLKESDLAAAAHHVAITADVMLAYPIIMTVHGQTLHNHHHANMIKNGDLVLGDFGAESKLHYASDITRTFPVAKKFTSQQKEVYDIVLKAQLSSISMLKPGIPYREVHLHAATVMAEGLKSLGLMKGDTAQAVQSGAHALFFPHGLGHMLGLDVHDMEDLGENHVGYEENTRRSDQFGLRYLRLSRPLEEGFVLTVEPGIYFIPELIDRWQSENRCMEFIDYSKLTAYRNFGGIRIEDDCVVTSTSGRVLGDPIAKTIAEIEELRTR